MTSSLLVSIIIVGTAVLFKYSDADVPEEKLIKAEPYQPSPYKGNLYIYENFSFVKSPENIPLFNETVYKTDDDKSAFYEVQKDDSEYKKADKNVKFVFDGKEYDLTLKTVYNTGYAYSADSEYGKISFVFKKDMSLSGMVLDRDSEKLTDTKVYSDEELVAATKRIAGDFADLDKYELEISHPGDITQIKYTTKLDGVEVRSGYNFRFIQKGGVLEALEIKGKSNMDIANYSDFSYDEVMKKCQSYFPEETYEWMKVEDKGYIYFDERLNAYVYAFYINYLQRDFFVQHIQPVGALRMLYVL